MRYSLFIITSLFLLSACGTTSLSKNEKDFLLTVSIEQPVHKRSGPMVICQLCPFTYAGPYKGKRYDDLGELYALVYKDNNIDISKIVFTELQNQLRGKSKLKLVPKNGDFVIRPVIYNYGYAPPSPFSTDISPMLSIKLHGDIIDKKDRWESSGTVTQWSNITARRDNYDLISTPSLIVYDFKTISKEAVRLALESYHEMFTQ